MKSRRTIRQETEMAIKSSLSFSHHMAQFSKLLSFLYVIMYAITWLSYLVIAIKLYFDTQIFQTEILDFILQPTLIIIGFYFATKVFENISEGWCKAYLEKNGDKKI